MTVTVVKSGAVTTVIHARPEARNAMDVASAEALVEAFLAFDRDPDAAVAVFWGAGGAFCAGWDLKLAASLAGTGRAAEGTRLPARTRPGAARPDGTVPPRALEAGHRRGRRAGGRRRLRARALVRPARDGGGRLFRRLLPALGHPAHRRRHRAPAAHRRPGPGPRHHPDRPQGHGRGGLPHRPLRARRAEVQGARGGRGARAGDRALPAGMPCAPTGASVHRQHGLPVAEALRREWENSVHVLERKALPARRGSRRARAAAAISGRSERFMTESSSTTSSSKPLEAVLPTLLEKSLERGWRAVVQATSRRAARGARRPSLDLLRRKLPPARDRQGAGRGRAAGRADACRRATRTAPRSASLSRARRSRRRSAATSASSSSSTATTRTALAAARADWKSVKAAGHDATYWQQDARGRWEKKA